MKNLYILLLSLACSTAISAQASDTDAASGDSIIESVLAEEPFADETFADEVTDEGALDEEMLSEEVVDLNSVPQDVLVQLQQDCSTLAQDEGVEAEMVAEFVETCVIDSVATELSMGAEDAEMSADEYAEYSTEDDTVEVVPE